MDQVRFGIIGIGTMGSNHAKWMEEGKIRGAVLSAVCDISPERVQWAQENLKETVAVFTDYKELIASGKVDAVLIATPHYFHPVIAVEALEAGLHTLVEKPAGVVHKGRGGDERDGGPASGAGIRHDVQPEDEPAVSEN